MTLDLAAINWLTVVVATVIYFALGAAWFAPQTPIGKAWGFIDASYHVLGLLLAGVMLALWR